MRTPVRSAKAALWSTPRLCGLLLVLAPQSVLAQLGFSGVPSVQCSLSTMTLTVDFNATTGMYVLPVDDDEEAMSSPDTEANILLNNETASREVKACWCTQFFNRPLEYCPADFDTCSVKGNTGTVRCFQSSGAASFVRGVWPVVLIWIVALLYTFSCTTPGRSTRQYLRRKWRSLWCKSPETDETLLANNVEHMVANHPERAVFLYRQALTRHRRDEERHRRRGTTPPANASAGHPFSPSEAHLGIPPSGRALVLKTKVYCADSTEDDESLQPGQSSAQAPQPHPRPQHPSAQPPSSWIPAQFRRDQVTMEEMDDELEQGVRCAICLDRLQNGDVIGDITCGHSFHKECLKDCKFGAEKCSASKVSSCCSG